MGPLGRSLLTCGPNSARLDRRIGKFNEIAAWARPTTLRDHPGIVLNASGRRDQHHSPVGTTLLTPVPQQMTTGDKLRLLGYRQ